MSIADENSVIVLDGEEIPVKAFTLDQLQVALGFFRDLDKVAANWDPDSGEGGPLSPEALSISAKLVSLAIDRPAGEVRASLDEVWVAIGKIKEVSGLIPLLRRLTSAVATAASTGTGSTPNS